MGSDQHYCLRWNNFHSNIAASFGHLRDTEDFVDVTLACEGKSLKAHKVVLSACSSYFKNLLKQNPCQHPIIIFRDVSFLDLAALLTFVYQGEVYVAEDRLTSFLRTAEMLHIKGLAGQDQQHPSNAGVPVSIGQPPSTVILPAPHDSNGAELKNVGNIVRVGATSPPHVQTPPSPSQHLYHLPVHISPPPKKRRLANVSTSLPSPTQPPSTPPPGMEGSTLAAALTKPYSRAETLVSPVMRTSTPKVVALQPVPVPASSPHNVPKVKLENELMDEVKREDEEAVNLVMEGSILRQRIQGYQGSPDDLQLGAGQNPMALEESSMDEYQTESCAGDALSDGGDTDKEVAGNTSLVIRSPLVGLLPRETQGLYGGAGTSTLSHHESTQDVVLNLSTGCNLKDTKKWPSRQPVNCQFCGVRISMAFNLRNHVKRCKMRPFNASTGQSVRASAMPGVSEADQQPCQPEETLEDPSLDSGGSHMSPLQQSVPQQVLPVDTHQLLPPGTEAAAPIPHSTPSITIAPVHYTSSSYPSSPPTDPHLPSGLSPPAHWQHQ